MSAAASPNLERHVAELERQTARLKSALSRGRWVTRLLLLGFAGFLCAVGYVLWSHYSHLRKPETIAEIQKLAGEAIAKNQKELNEHLEKLGKEVQPLAEKAGKDQWEKDQPAFAKALEQQGADFEKSIQKQLRAKLDGHYATALAEMTELLKAEVPELAQDQKKLERVQNTLLDATQRMVEERGVKRLEKGFTAVEKNWFAMAAAPPQRPGDMETHWKILGHALEIFYQVGTQPDAIAKLSDAAAPPLLRPAGMPAKAAAPKEAPKPEAPPSAKADGK